MRKASGSPVGTVVLYLLGVVAYVAGIPAMFLLFGKAGIAAAFLPSDEASIGLLAICYGACCLGAVLCALAKGLAVLCEVRDSLRGASMPTPENSTQAMKANGGG